MDKILNSRPVVAMNDAVVQFLYTQENPTIRSAVEKLEQLTGLKREKAFYLAVVLLTTVVVLFSLGQQIHLFLGLTYPAMSSLRAVRSLRKSKINIGSKSTEDVCKWIVYWCIFATFSTIEVSSGIGEMRGIFQLYWIAKVIFLVLLYAPGANGAMILYEMAIEPALARIDTSSPGSKKAN
ncbi:hypothetical protein QR680_005751 [Steinernema hermaphroditum]|uniref:Receptor expression-enhancing protein n=1 Tax=Steinernema hermaphroditum TaxID=289476 RepID=A0AA39LW89_9BILA|nr:hypothetical protein QR680_005751 [Steinernema hermaphroditum]